MRPGAKRKRSRYLLIVVIALCMVAPIFVVAVLALLCAIFPSLSDKIEFPGGSIFQWSVVVDVFCFPILLYLAERARQKATALPPPFECTVCGYDLRATPARCPECGAVPLIFPKRR